MYARGETIGSLRVDRSLLDDATECRLEMLRRAAEAVVEIDVAARGFHVVAPQQAHDAPARPHAFGRARGDRELRFGLLVFGDRLGRFLLLGLGLVGGLLVALFLLAWRLGLPLLLSRSAPLVLCRSRDCGPQQNAAGQQGGGGTDGAAQHRQAPDAGGEHFWR